MLLTENAYRMLTNASPASAAPFPEPYAHASGFVGCQPAIIPSELTF